MRVRSPQVIDLRTADALRPDDLLAVVGLLRQPIPSGRSSLVTAPQTSRRSTVVAVPVHPGPPSRARPAARCCGTPVYLPSPLRFSPNTKLPSGRADHEHDSMYFLTHKNHWGPATRSIRCTSITGRARARASTTCDSASAEVQRAVRQTRASKKVARSTITDNRPPWQAGRPTPAAWFWATKPLHDRIRCPDASV